MAIPPLARTDYLAPLNPPIPEEASRIMFGQPPVIRPSIAFGALEWNQYVGDVGEEPPLPPNIGEILSSPCPYFPGQQVGDTHLFMLIPKTVDGVPFSLNLLLTKLIQRPKGEGKALDWNLAPTHYDPTIREEHGNCAIPKSYWALMTKDVLPTSRDKTYHEQCALLKGPYDLPHVLEAATMVLMHYIKNGERLYSNSPNTYTRCQEKVNYEKHRAVFGGFEPSGLYIHYCYGCSNNDYKKDFLGISGVRRLYVTTYENDDPNDPLGWQSCKSLKSHGKASKMV